MESFDYILVGAGSADFVLAKLLSSNPSNRAPGNPGRTGLRALAAGANGFIELLQGQRAAAKLRLQQSQSAVSRHHAGVFAYTIGLIEFNNCYKPHL